MGFSIRSGLGMQDIAPSVVIRVPAVAHADTHGSSPELSRTNCSSQRYV